MIIKLEEGYVKVFVDGCLKGVYIVMDKVSVGVMVIIMCVVILVEGIMIIENVVCELEIVDIVNFLIMLGVKISG